jgi:hypothetical protein
MSLLQIKHLAKSFFPLSVFILTLTLTGCFSAEVLSPEPSALDTDNTGPTCNGLTDVTVTDGPSLTLAWSEASDAVSEASKITYLIYMKSLTSNYDLVSPTKIVVGATTTLITSGLDIGGTYTLFVACKDEAGNVAPTGPTNERTVTINDTEAPGAITGLTATALNSYTITLIWPAADDGDGGTLPSAMVYKVYGSTSTPVSTTGTPLSTTAAGAITYQHTGLNPSTTWHYKVVAVDESSNAALDSNEVSATTASDTTAPTITPAITITGRGTSSIGISFTEGSDNTVSSTFPKSRVYRCSGSTTCNPFTQNQLTANSANELTGVENASDSCDIVLLAKGTSTYTDTCALSANTIYVYGVRSYDYADNISTNTDTLVTSTIYSSTGVDFAVPTLAEANIRLGQGVALGHFYGTPTGATAYIDLALGAPNGSEQGSQYLQTGCVYIYEGLAGGIFSSTPVQSICQPNESANGANNRNFGYAIARGDFNNDTYDDLVVSSPNVNEIYYYYFNTSTQRLAYNTTISFLLGGTQFGMGLCTGNIDGTGGDDVVTITPTLNCYDNCGVTGTGNFQIYSNSGTLASHPSNLGSYLVVTNTNSGADTITLDSAAGLAVNDKFIYFAGTAITGLTSGTYYFVKTKSGNDITVSATSGGATINLTSASLPAGTQVVMGPISSGYTSPATAFAAAGYIVESADVAVQSCTIGSFDSGNASQKQIVFGSGDIEISAGTANDGAIAFYRITGANTLSFQNAIYGVSPGNSWGSAVQGVNIDTGGIQELLIGAPLDDTNGTDNGIVMSYDVTVNSSNFEISQRNSFKGGAYKYASNGFGSALAAGSVSKLSGGREDVVIGAPLEDGNTAATGIEMGLAYLYKNSGTLIDTTTDQSNFDASTASAGFTQYYGQAMCKGDVNNDSYPDVVVGSPGQNYNPTPSQAATTSDQGVVYIYYGQQAGEMDFDNPELILYSPGNLASSFGSSCTIFDYNDDGLEDLLVGAPTRAMDGVTGRGNVFIYIGQDNADPYLDPIDLQVPDALRAGRTVTSVSAANNTLTVTNANSYFGLGDRVVYSTTGTVATGLTNGTVYYVASVDTPTAGGVRLSTTFANALAGTVIDITGAGTGTQRLRISDASGAFGSALAHGDLDGNGQTDLVVGATGQGGTTGAGRVYVFWGTTGGGGVSSTNFRIVRPPYGSFGTTYNPNLQNTQLQTDPENFGYAVEVFNNIADVTGGGDDLVVCTPFHDYGASELGGSSGAATNAGQCLVYKGSDSSLSGADYTMATYPDIDLRYPFSALGNTDPAYANVYFGSAITKGDWNNDNIMDLVICAMNQRGYKGLSNSVNSVGACYPYFGLSGGGLNLSNIYRGYSIYPETTDDHFYNNNGNASFPTNFGRAVLLLDINDNDVTDLLVGESSADQGSLNPNTTTEHNGVDSGRVYINRGCFKYQEVNQTGCTFTSGE